MQLLAEDAVLAEAVLRIPAQSLCRRILTDTIVILEALSASRWPEGRRLWCGKAVVPMSLRSLLAAAEPTWSQPCLPDGVRLTVWSLG